LTALLSLDRCGRLAGPGYPPLIDQLNTDLTKNDIAPSRRRTQMAGTRPGGEVHESGFQQREDDTQGHMQTAKGVHTKGVHTKGVHTSGVAESGVAESGVQQREDDTEGHMQTAKGVHTSGVHTSGVHTSGGVQQRSDPEGPTDDR
jgi:hypothetical protein